MPYKNPPVVEAWIAFDFEPHANKTGWDFEPAREFLRLHAPALTQRRLHVQNVVELEKNESDELPKVKSERREVQLVRAFDSDLKRLLQVGNDRMAYNLLERGADFPGFDVLLDEAMGYLEKYRTYFSPPRLQRVTIHYVDIVNIPVEGSSFNLEDYFLIIRDIPENPFGLVTNFASFFTTICPLDDEPVKIEIQRLPTAADQRTVQVLLEWEKSCRNLDCNDPAEIKSALTESNAFMVKCFKASITSKTEALFA